MRSRFVVVAALLVAQPLQASAQVRFGWTTDCMTPFEAASHLAVLEAIEEPDGASAQPLGEVLCGATSHSVEELERRPPSIPTLTLIAGQGQTCVAPVQDDVIVRITSDDERIGPQPTRTFLAHRFDASGCEGALWPIVAVGGAVSVVSTGVRSGAQPPDEIRAIADPDRSDARLRGFELPEARAWLVIAWSGEASIVRDGALLPDPDYALRSVTTIVRTGERALLLANGVDNDEWLGEIGPQGVSLVAAGGSDAELARLRRAAVVRAIDESEEAIHEEEVATAGRGLGWGAAGLLIVLVVVLVLVLVARPRWPEKRVPWMLTGSVSVAVAAAIARVVAGFGIAALAVIFANGSWIAIGIGAAIVGVGLGVAVMVQGVASIVLALGALLNASSSRVAIVASGTTILASSLIFYVIVGGYLALSEPMMLPLGIGVAVADLGAWITLARVLGARRKT